MIKFVDTVLSLIKLEPLVPKVQPVCKPKIELSRKQKLYLKQKGKKINFFV